MSATRKPERNVTCIFRIEISRSPNEESGCGKFNIRTSYCMQEKKRKQRTSMFVNGWQNKVKEGKKIYI